MNSWNRTRKMLPSEFRKQQRLLFLQQQKQQRRNNNNNNNDSYHLELKRIHERMKKQNKKGEKEIEAKDFYDGYFLPREDSSRNVAIFLSPGYDFVVALLACWLANCCAVPLNVNATKPEIDHILNDTGTQLVICSPSCLKQNKTSSSTSNLNSWNPSTDEEIKKSNRVAIPFSVSSTTQQNENEIKSLSQNHRQAIFSILQNEILNLKKTKYNNNTKTKYNRKFDDDALMVATSGTTGKPKACVHSHYSISNQCRVLMNAWQWSSNDSILHTLPLHHVHGLINCLCCAVASSASIEFKKFEPAIVVKRLKSGDFTVFHCVPAAYKKIISYLLSQKNNEEEREDFKLKMKEHIKLFVSGSSACPLPVLKEFEQLSSHVLLERYGMSETGMILSAPLYPISARIPGSVGCPLETVKVKTISESTITTTKNSEEEKSFSENEDAQSLLVQSGSMFSRYWNNAIKTAESFVVIDGEEGAYFDTGDVVKKFFFVDDSGMKMTFFTIQGRSSVDIIKSSAYKISAVEIENVLLDSGLVEEVAVFPVLSSTTTQKKTEDAANETADADEIVAIITPSTTTTNTNPTDLVAALKKHVEQNLSHYKRPHLYLFAPNGIERNSMGKIQKKQLVKHFDTLKQNSDEFCASSFF